MSNLSPKPMRAFQFASAMTERELAKRRRSNPSFNPDELWASVTHQAHICVGTPLIPAGKGYYVDYKGNWKEA